MRTPGYLLLGLMVAIHASADEIILKNGDRITGKIIDLKKGKLAIKTEAAGKIEVAWDRVAVVTTDEPVRVKLETREVLEGTLSAGEDGRLKVQTRGAANPVEVEFSKVTHFNEPPADWHGSLDLAGRSTDGNTHTRGFIIAGNAERVTEVDRMEARVVFRYTDERRTIQERNSYGLAKYQRYLGKQTYAYLSGEVMSDKFKDLRLGLVVSAGGGMDFIKEDALSFSGEAGIAYSDNNFRLAPDEGHVGARIATTAKAKLPFGFVFTDRFTWYTNFEDTADWQIRNEGGLSTSVGKGWTFRMGIITEIDNEPSIGLEEHDNTYFVGLGYRF